MPLEKALMHVSSIGVQEGRLNSDGHLPEGVALMSCIYQKSSLLTKCAILFFACLLSFGTVALAEHQVSSKTARSVQSELKQKGYYEGDIDGVIGPRTREGLRRYQKEQGLAGDGRLTHETAVSLGVSNKDAKPGEHFEDAGTEIKDHYGEGGKALGRSGKEMGKDVKEGEVTEGAKDLGKGAGKFGKEVGKGTGKAAKKVGKGVKDAVDGEDHEKKKP